MMKLPSACDRVGSLFGPQAIVVTHIGAGDPQDLLPAERACTIGFGAVRLAEYAAGRACVKAALRAYDITGYALVTEADRRPRWPVGIVGSITHSGDACGAVVARDSAYAAVGLDVEHRHRVERELWPSLFVASERERLSQLGETDADIYATLIFSAKESFYKARYTLTERWLDFTDVSVDVDAPDAAGRGRYTAALVLPDRGPRLDVLHGRYVVERDLVWTGTFVGP